MGCTFDGCQNEVDQPLTIRLYGDCIKYEWCRDHVEMVRKRCPLLVNNGAHVLSRSRRENAPYYALSLLVTVILFVLAILHINSQIVESIILGLSAIIFFIFLYKLEAILRKHYSFEDACIEKELRDLEELVSDQMNRIKKKEQEIIESIAKEEKTIATESIK